MRDEELDRMVEEIDRDGEDLTPWEREFIGKLIDKPPALYSPNQAAAIRKIYEERMP